ncbi:GatB/YqeY domain-containing protein [bacterium]|nr:MAG: GatB/YqeY domain-containing protein [bacterium]
MVQNDMIDKLNTDLKNAMKSGDKMRLDTIRMMKASLQKVVIEKGNNFTPDDGISFLLAEAKRRKEAIELYEKGGRQDMADQEKKELEIISEYLPKPLDEKELLAIVEATIKDFGAQTAKDMGKVMSAVMQKVKGQADGKKIQDMVKTKLG